MRTESSRDIQLRASEWLAQRDAGRWTASDEAHFQEWLDASVIHRTEFLRIEAAWARTRRMKALAAGIPAERPPPCAQWNLSPIFESAGEPRAISEHAARWRRMPAARRLGMIAASALLALAAGIGGWSLWPAGQQYRTPVGGTSSVPMRDGSKITLNTDSEIRVALSATERRVDLTQGEAFFDVAKDPMRPFVVEAGRKRVIAVGTRFAVRRDGESVEVVVTDGKVRVEDVSVGGGELLTAGSIARAGRSGVLVQRKTVSETEQALSWRSGILTFRDEELADAIAEFNRYNERRVVIEDPAIAALKIEGNFRATNVSEFLELLQGGYPVKVTAEADRFVLSEK